MKCQRLPETSLYLDVLHTLEDIGAQYAIIGAFGASLYGVTRVTYDIDMVVNLTEQHIQALAAAYPPPRFYADPVQMRDSIRRGILFNIIDTSRGEKADLVPLTMDPRYRRAFDRRVRQFVDIPGGEPFEVWCARPDDLIAGKLMAWAEGHSRKHETDVYEMMVFHYLNPEPEGSLTIGEAYVDAQAEALGYDVVQLWEAIKDAARREAGRVQGV